MNEFEIQRKIEEIRKMSVLDSLNWTLEKPTNLLQLLTVAETFIIDTGTRTRSEQDLISVSITDGLANIYSDTHGWPSANKAMLNTLQAMEIDKLQYFFSLGDFIAADGPEQLQSLALHLLAMVKFPERAFIIQGNCEYDEMICWTEGLMPQINDFCEMEYFHELGRKIHWVVKRLPIWIVLRSSSTDQAIAMVHGGPIREEVHVYQHYSREPVELDLWGDFNPELKDTSTPMSQKRKAHFTRDFGLPRVQHCLKELNCQALLRGHQKLPGVKEQGFQIDGEGVMATFMSGSQKGKIKVPRKCMIDMTVPFTGFKEEMFIALE